MTKLASMTLSGELFNFYAIIILDRQTSNYYVFVTIKNTASNFCAWCLLLEWTGLDLDQTLIYRYLKSAVLTAFPGVFVNLTLLLVWTLQYWPAAVHRPPAMKDLKF